MSPEELAAIRRQVAAAQGRFGKEFERTTRRGKWGLAAKNMGIGGSAYADLIERLADVDLQMANELEALIARAEAGYKASEREKRERGARIAWETGGTILGGLAGFLLGGPPGAAVGAGLGHAAGGLAGGAATGYVEPDVANDIMASISVLSNMELMKVLETIGANQPRDPWSILLDRLAAGELDKFTQLNEPRSRLESLPEWQTEPIVP